MHRKILQRRGSMLAVATVVVAAFLTVVPTAATADVGPAHAVAAARIAATPGRPDAYIRDAVADVGKEPDPARPVWDSPDIWVCRTAAPCTGTDPVVGATNFVNVHLNNVGTTAVPGTVNIYFTAMGASAIWPSSWTPISSVAGVTVPPGGITVQLPWPSVPGPGHFCLLARWVSTVDPMTFPEGRDTLTNTVNNNNIAWHNVDTVVLPIGKPVSLPFTLTDTSAGAEGTDLVFTAPNGPFIGPGSLTIDLGSVLAARWAAAGQQGVGVSQLNGTQVQILNPSDAQIIGLTVQPQESLQTTLIFEADSADTASVRVDETDTTDDDLGGVEYDLSTSTSGSTMSAR